MQRNKKTIMYICNITETYLLICSSVAVPPNDYKFDVKSKERVRIARAYRCGCLCQRDRPQSFPSCLLKCSGFRFECWQACLCEEKSDPESEGFIHFHAPLIMSSAERSVQENSRSRGRGEDERELYASSYP